MSSFFIFVVRLILALIISTIVCRIFFQGIETYKVLGLATIFFALAYLFEYLRHMGKDDNRT